MICYDFRNQIDEGASETDGERQGSKLTFCFRDTDSKIFMLRAFSKIVAREMFAVGRITQIPSSMMN
jgi:hypothetical protein